VGNFNSLLLLKGSGLGKFWIWAFLKLSLFFRLALNLCFGFLHLYLRNLGKIWTFWFQFFRVMVLVWSDFSLWNVLVDFGTWWSVKFCNFISWFKQLLRFYEDVLLFIWYRLLIQYYLLKLLILINWLFRLDFEFMFFLI
jgi:hypothetical protein